MTELTPPSEKLFSFTGAASPAQQNGEGPSSPVLPICPMQTWSKPRKAPTITPRSFTRFFTPKSTAERGARIGASRKALRDITTSALNRKGRRTPTIDSIKLELFDDTVITVKTKKRKTYIPSSPYPSPDPSSPLKRVRKRSPELLGEDDTNDDAFKVEDEDRDLAELGHSYSVHVDRLVRTKYLSRLGRGLRQETGCHFQQIGTVDPDRCNAGSHEYQYETSNLYTKSEDAHSCYNISLSSAHTIPFCTASCNTNSLVAVGDEDGGVRLLESARDEKPGFSKPWLTFRPHANAILDLNFSPDDLRLATASGDQTARIIDMPTQRVLHTMTGHLSSVKQVRFQPESSDVLATSSRDGNIQIWDLRCKGFAAPVRDLLVPLVPVDSSGTITRTAPPQEMTWARSVNTIVEAHANHQPQTLSSRQSAGASLLKTPPSFDAPSRTETPGRRGDVSITTLAFLPAPRSHLLLSGSEANASVKLWDLRLTHSQRRSSRTATALSSTRQPESHNRHRHFGLTSMSLSGDAARLYTLCRDNTVYAYSTSHLMLGSAPELSISNGTSMRPKRYSSSGQKSEGLGPLYGFRHPSFHATTFYVSSAVRPAGADRSELLAVGSSDGCAVVFPTNERYMNPHHQRTPDPSTPNPSMTANPRRRTGLTRTDSGLSGRLNDTVPIYQHGTALVRGHSREVTGLTWTKGGELVTVGDDFGVRCWREDDREAARGLRLGGESQGRRWGCGWAEVDSSWDDDDD